MLLHSRLSTCGDESSGNSTFAPKSERIHSRITFEISTISLSQSFRTHDCIRTGSLPLDSNFFRTGSSSRFSVNGQSARSSNWPHKYLSDRLSYSLDVYRSCAHAAPDQQRKQQVHVVKFSRIICKPFENRYARCKSPLVSPLLYRNSAMLGAHLLLDCGRGGGSGCRLIAVPC